MTDIAREINDLKKEIAVAKQDKAYFEGSLKTMLNDLKDKYQISSLDEVSKKIELLKKNNIKIDRQIVIKFKKLKENFTWGQVS